MVSALSTPLKAAVGRFGEAFGSCWSVFWAFLWLVSARSTPLSCISVSVAVSSFLFFLGRRAARRILGSFPRSWLLGSCAWLLKGAPGFLFGYRVAGPWLKWRGPMILPIGIRSPQDNAHPKTRGARLLEANGSMEGTAPRRVET